MKWILFAAGLIAAAQAASAGPIKDKYDVCIAHTFAIYHQCLAGASNEGEGSLCLMNQYTLSGGCADVAHAEIAVDSSRW